jgi:hypothetical protein
MASASDGNGAMDPLPNKKKMTADERGIDNGTTLLDFFAWR